MPAGWHERLVGWADGGFRFTVGPGSAPLAAALAETVRQAPVGSVAELCPAAIAVASGIGRRIAAAGGAALIVDYGHARSAPGDTLQAVRAHHPVPVLDDPGEADIPAHVAFEMVARARREEI